MWQRFTERARRVVFFAQEEAAKLGENYVDTEHMLLGLIRESDSVASRILDRLGVPLGRIRADIERQVARGQGNLGQDMQLTSEGKRVIDLAYDEARGLNNNYIGTEHLLLGLIREGDGLAARVLVTLGADLEGTRREVRAMQEAGGMPGEHWSTASSDAVRTLIPRLRTLSAHVRSGALPTETEPDDSPDTVLRDATEADLSTLSFDSTVKVVENVTELARAMCADLTDLRAITDLSRVQAETLLRLAEFQKKTLKNDKEVHSYTLRGKTLAMVFEKQSLRTRVSFEVGMFQLGGHAIYLQPADISMGKRETVADVARNLDRMVDGIMARVFAHSTILELAEHSRVPVINGLCDREHPCQALCDFLTILEHRGTVAGQKVVYVGDGNNVAHSLLLLGAKLGAHVVIACPKGYEPLPEIVALGEADAAANGGSVVVTNDARAAAEGADVLYTDVWTSMGQEAETQQRLKDFAGYQINAELAALAKPDYLFMHCLPAHRGEEVSADVADGPNSVIFDQAENRLHAQKAVLSVLL